MTRIAFFGHDVTDAAIRRRVKSFQDDGLDVQGFMMRRRESGTVDWPNTDLGETRDGAFIQRFRSIFSGASKAAAKADTLRRADVIYARNLDMLATAFLTKRKLKLKTPVIYECLDVHRLLCRKDVVGKALRWIEGSLLKRCIGLVVSSPAFLSEHFEKHYAGQYRALLVENRLTEAFEGLQRPEKKKIRTEGSLRLGWVGMLRCQRTLDLMCQLAETLGDRLEIRVHGIPAEREIPNFHDQIGKHENIKFFGRYRAPEDLAEIYGDLDFVWSGDFMEAGLNSVWLLPNRLYEGGFYACPALTPAGTQTAKWLAERKCGLEVEEPLETTLLHEVEALIADPSPLQTCADQLLALSTDTFVQPRGFLADMIEGFLTTVSAEQLAPADGQRLNIQKV